MAQEPNWRTTKLRFQDQTCSSTYRDLPPKPSWPDSHVSLKRSLQNDISQLSFVPLSNTVSHYPLQTHAYTHTHTLLLDSQTNLVSFILLSSFSHVLRLDEGKIQGENQLFVFLDFSLSLCTPADATKFFSAHKPWYLSYFCFQAGTQVSRPEHKGKP